MSTPGMPRTVPESLLRLQSPRSLAVYDTYDDAQRAVDYLSDRGFPVQNVLIVGTDLRQVERVMGRLTMGKVVGGGALSGMWLGLMVGLLLMVFVPGGGWDTLASSVVAGVVFFAIWAALGYAFTQGKRDFTSVSQVVATRYEILVEAATFTDADTILRGPQGTRPATDPAAPADGTGPQPG